MSIESLVRHFGAVEDPRCSGKVGTACSTSW